MKYRHFNGESTRSSVLKAVAQVLAEMDDPTSGALAAVRSGGVIGVADKGGDFV